MLQKNHINQDNKQKYRESSDQLYREDRLNNFMYVSSHITPHGHDDMFHKTNMHQKVHFVKNEQESSYCQKGYSTRYRKLKSNTAFQNRKMKAQQNLKMPETERSRIIKENCLELAQELIKERQAFYSKKDLLMHIDYCICGKTINKYKFKKNRFETRHFDINKCICKEFK